MSLIDKFNGYKGKSLYCDIALFTEFFNRNIGYHTVEAIISHIGAITCVNITDNRVDKLISGFEPIIPKDESLRPIVEKVGHTVKDLKGYNRYNRYTPYTPYSFTNLTKYLKSIVSHIKLEELKFFINTSGEIGYIRFENDFERPAFRGIGFVYYIMDNKLHMVDHKNADVPDTTMALIMNLLNQSHRDYLHSLINFTKEEEFRLQIRRIVSGFKEPLLKGVFLNPAEILTEEIQNLKDNNKE